MDMIAWYRILNKEGEILGDFENIEEVIEAIAIIGKTTIFTYYY